jgi:hypothetical protein
MVSTSFFGLKNCITKIRKKPIIAAIHPYRKVLLFGKSVCLTVVMTKPMLNPVALAASNTCTSVDLFGCRITHENSHTKNAAPIGAPTIYPYTSSLKKPPKRAANKAPPITAPRSANQLNL